MGVIDKIQLVNFMCHRRLEVHFSPNVNFVLGRNGSKLEFDSFTLVLNYRQLLVLSTQRVSLNTSIIPLSLYSSYEDVGVSVNRGRWGLSIRGGGGVWGRGGFPAS